MRIEFKDFSGEVKGKIRSALIEGLYEAAGELQGRAIRKSPADQGELRNAWKYAVDENKLEATVGNTLEYSIYQEFGTGEYALNGDGRKGGWYIPAEKLSPKARSILPEAKLKNGKMMYFTKGTKPKRMLFTAFTQGKNTAIRLIQNKLKELK